MAAVLQNRDSVAEAEYLIQPVADVEDELAFRSHRSEQLGQLLQSRCVQRSCRFVQMKICASAETAFWRFRPAAARRPTSRCAIAVDGNAAAQLPAPTSPLAASPGGRRGQTARLAPEEHVFGDRQVRQQGEFLECGNAQPARLAGVFGAQRPHSAARSRRQAYARRRAGSSASTCRLRFPRDGVHRADVTGDRHRSQRFPVEPKRCATGSKVTNGSASPARLLRAGISLADASDGASARSALKHLLDFVFGQCRWHPEGVVQVVAIESFASASRWRSAPGQNNRTCAAIYLRAARRSHARATVRCPARRPARCCPACFRSRCAGNRCSLLPVIGTSSLPVSLNTPMRARHVRAGEPDGIDRLAGEHQIFAKLLALGVVPVAEDFSADLDVAAHQRLLQAIVTQRFLDHTGNATEHPDGAHRRASASATRHQPCRAPRCRD